MEVSWSACWSQTELVKALQACCEKGHQVLKLFNPHTTKDINLLNHFIVELLGGYVVDDGDGALQLTLGLFHHGISALNLAFALSKPGGSLHFFFFMTFITIVHPSTSIITFDLIQFYLPEVIICPCIHPSLLWVFFLCQRCLNITYHQWFKLKIFPVLLFQYLCDH